MKLLYKSMILLFLIGVSTVLAQDTIGNNANKNFKVSGSAGIMSEFTSTSNTQGLDSMRRNFNPNGTIRGNAMLNITLFEQVELPFEFWFTTSEVSFQQPFNQFGVNPRIGDWLVLHAGYFFCKLSDLSFGDSRMLGGGFELTPGNFKLTALYGIIRQERNEDTTINFAGELERKALAIKIGFGKENSFYANLNFAKSWDDTAKHFNNINAPLPKDNFITSINFGTPITEYVRLSAEAAISAFTNDLYAKDVASPDIPSFVNSIFNAKNSSQVDAAFKAGIFVTPHRNFNFRINTQWIGPGFQSLGFPQLQNDVLDLLFAPSIRLLDGNLSIKGSIGIRENNLRDNHLSNTQRVISSMDIYSQFNQELSLSAQYSNYGMRTNLNKDTLHIQNISQVFSITPMANYQWFDANNNVSFTYSYQDVDDRNSYDTLFQKNVTHTVNLSYSIMFESSLNLTTSLFYNENVSNFSSTITSVTETIGYGFMERKLNCSFTFGFTNTETIQSDTQLSLRLSASYTIEKYGSLSLNISNLNYNSGQYNGSTVGIPSYSELQGALQYGISF